MLRVEFYCTPGSPSFIFDGNTLTERGVGGAEYGIITVAEEMAERGWEVTVYNHPPHGAVKINGVQYVESERFDLRAPHDVFILFRNPMPQLTLVNARRRIFWSCDQFTEGNYQTEVFPFVDVVVTISPYHADYFVEHYRLRTDKLCSIDLPVRVSEYADGNGERDANALLYCSVPDRGLIHLARLFPQIRAQHPAAKLWVTSDYTLWGEGVSSLNDRFRIAFAGIEGVEFMGKVPRARLVELQESANVLAYPNQPVGGLAELFCISAAECQVAGAFPITSKRGGLETTVQSGVLIDGEPGEDRYDEIFIQTAVAHLETKPEDLRPYREEMTQRACERFAPQRIVDEWSVLF